MKTIVEFLLVFFLRVALWFRYRFTIKGLDKLNPNILNKPGGVLFLTNHPTVFLDVTSVTLALWPKFHLRPLVVEYMYHTPIINSVMRLLDAVPVPSFATSSNSLKRKKTEQVIKTVEAGLKEKQNFLIAPAGRVKHTAYEAIDGASAVHRIVQETPEANIVLVRVKGAWGSSFSRALTGQNPFMFATMFRGMKHAFKNLLFFTPRREIIIEFEPVQADFPYKADRLEFNRYLEKWYNQPDNLRPQTEPYPGDSLVLVSYSMWRNELPTPWTPALTESQISLENIPKDIQEKVIHKLSEITEQDPKNITPNTILSTDLGLDSLDTAELIAFLQDQFDVSGVSPSDLTSVGKIMAIAARQIVCEDSSEEENADLSQWNRAVKKCRVQIAAGQTIPEVFLNNCDRMHEAIACGDMRSGVVSYSQLKLRTLILAKYLSNLPGKYVGILLPASVAASIAILACQLAGKIPLMINWTVGPRHLQAVVELSKVQIVLSSWAFLDRLQNVDLNGIEELLVMLEDVRHEISFKDKIKAWILSKRKVTSILQSFPNQPTKESEAVLLFTSGTENQPKGVPLTHDNILTNLRASLESFDLFSDDRIFGILPPFHSFGFTVNCLAGLLSGVKIAFSPDPTDGKRLANGFAHWGITVAIGAPTFIKGLIKAATPLQLATMRLCVVGAEKLPAELEQAVAQLGKSQALIEGYGVTECSPILSFTRYGKPRKGVGKPLSNVDICIVDLETHALQPIGQQGLILARGPNVFKGYLNPGQSSPFLTVEGKSWYNTGDLGYQDEEGNVIISGRLKRFIKVGGEMVSLASIEDALYQAALSNGSIPPTEEGPSMAIGAKENPGEKPKIFLFSKLPMSVDEANRILREAGFSNLIKITSVVQLEEIPLMGSGKVHYRKLMETHQPEK